MATEMFFEDYVLDEARTSTGRTITETDFVIHAGHTGDFYPHHMDAEWCKTQSFGARIAHGTLVFAVSIGMSAGEINPRAFTYGYDALRFVGPVYIGDTITVQVAVAAKRDDVKRLERGFVDERCVVTNQRGETVMVCNHIISVERRQPEQSPASAPVATPEKHERDQ